MSDDDDAAIDPMLQAFVALVDEAKAQEDVTLLVGGSWISGTLIPPRMYLEEVAQMLDAAGKDGVATFFRLKGRHWFPSEHEGATAEHAEAAARPHHAHLRSARLFVSGGFVPEKGGFIRIKLSTVDGWLTGGLGPPGYRPAVPPPPPG